MVSKVMREDGAFRQKEKCKMKHKMNVFIIMLILLIVISLLSGCSENSAKGEIKSKIVGSWYFIGKPNCTFTLYEDNTCKSAEEDILGTWWIINDNKLRFINYYGKSETVTIEKFENNEMILSVGDTRRVFVKRISETNTHKMWQ